MFGDTRIDAITLFESQTKANGSVYRELHRISFKSAQNSRSDASERQTSAVQLSARNESSVEVEIDIDTDDGWPRGHIPNT
jgi:hypothetical protein